MHPDQLGLAQPELQVAAVEQGVGEGVRMLQPGGQGHGLLGAGDELVQALVGWAIHRTIVVPAELRTWGDHRTADPPAGRQSLDGASDMTSRTSIHSYSGSPPGPGSEET